MGSDAEVIAATGVVKEFLPDGRVRVELANKHCILAEVSAKIKVRFIRINPGDLVRVELSPHDPSKARVVQCL